MKADDSYDFVAGVIYCLFSTQASKHLDILRMFTTV